MRLSFLLVVLACAADVTAQVTSPTVDQILSLKRAGSPQIAPDGRFVAYTIQRTNWDENAYETDLWLADTQTGHTRQLTTARKSSTAPAWSPDGTRLAFLSDRSDKRQIYVIDPHGGEAERLTSVEEGVSSFAWAPDGQTIAFASTEPQSASSKDREKKYGEFQIVDADKRQTHLFLLTVATSATRQLTSGPFTVGRYAWSPDGTRIAFDHQINTSPGSSGTADISIVTVADGVTRDLVTQEGPDTHPVWSPDGSQIAFETSMANPAYYYANHPIAIVAATGGSPIAVTTRFDEDPSIVAWKPTGLYFTATDRTYAYLYRLDVTSRSIVKMNPVDRTVTTACTLSADAGMSACLRADASSMPEVIIGSRTGDRKLTNLNAQTAEWRSGTLEVVSWTSQDGTAIEGVLHKPVDFNPAAKYPLLVVVHGGPTGTSRAIPFTSTIYPIDVWVPRGVLVLEPNYRGSAGYGEKFRSLNVRNLGVGDAWDVLSGIDALVAKGVVDPNRVGVMGWSQGGYISAFLATHDAARFKAISVGAGISDWMTYYVNTDIHPFTRQYLKATPWDDPDVYAKTSPITYIKQARTPTLIQHGATDQRVPLPDAYELYQGLQDNHVPTKLIVYKGFEGVGHGPSRPKSHRATMDHNLEWFDQYLFQAGTKTSQ